MKLYLLNVRKKEGSSYVEISIMLISRKRILIEKDRSRLVQGALILQ